MPKFFINQIYIYFMNIFYSSLLFDNSNLFYYKLWDKGFQVLEVFVQIDPILSNLLFSFEFMLFHSLP